MNKKIDISNSFGVYQIKCLINSKLYIGSTTRSFARRFHDHRYSLNSIKKRHHNPHLRNAWDKYGEANFEFSVLEVVEDKDLVLEREQYYLDILKPEYNIAKEAKRNADYAKERTLAKLKSHIPWNKGKSGEYSLGPRSQEIKDKISQAQKGRLISLETRRKISLAGIGRISPNKGKEFTEEHKQKLSRAKIGNTIRKGGTLSKEARTKISEANKGKLTKEKNPMWGKIHTQEAREKLSRSHIGKTYIAKPFKVQSPSGVIFEGTNLNEFCRSNDLSPGCMSLVKQGKQNSHKGWIFL